MTLQSTFRVALKALAKNKLQSALTMVGMTIGVATVLTMIALGSGAESAIQDQVRAAGMNLIFITAGNYKIKTDDDGQAIEENARLRLPAPGHFMVQTAVWDPARGPQFLLAHAEDDPMVKHDHPTAAQRLGDSEAGLGSAATLTGQRCQAIRKLRGVQYVSEGVHENAHVSAGQQALVYASARRRCLSHRHPARLEIHVRPVLHAPRRKEHGPGDRAGLGGEPKSYSAAPEPGGQDGDHLEAAVPGGGRGQQR